jgi:hypothetical protein
MHISIYKREEERLNFNGTVLCEIDFHSTPSLDHVS